MRAYAVVVVAGLFVAQVSAADIGKPRADLDAIFARWSAPDGPGCALAVSSKDEVTYARGYGMANLETGTRITPGSIFDIGSVSKQFTAMAVVLLAQDGKLSLDDDIRKYLPEIPAYGGRITIAQLLHHTSGLRNYTDLFDLAGVPEVSLTTAADALELIARQRDVNFRAGDEFLYSDTNYFLAGEIVARVSGQSLRAFAQQRIFGPLGMASTRFNDRPREVIPGRAVGYEPVASGYLNYLSNFEQVGDGSVLTTVLDLARWERNFSEARVGGRDGVALLMTKGRLNNGSEIAYGMGLFIDDYRGLPWVHHDGEWVGYRAAVSRFPSERLSVIVTCNTIGDLDPMGLALKVSDVLLAGRLGPPPAPRAAYSADAAIHAGVYWSPERGSVRRFEANDGVLTLGAQGSGQALESLGSGLYRTTGETATTYRFVAGAAATAAALEATTFGTTARYYRVNPALRPAHAPAELAGVYVTPDLPAPWTLVSKDGRLWRHQAYMHDVELEPVFEDTYVGSLSEGDFLIHAVRDDGGHVTGLLVSGEMLRPILLAREPAGTTSRP